MVADQLMKRGILDPRVLDVMRRIPRDRFVPGDQCERAYEDRALAIGHDQTISQPYMVALMLKVLTLAGNEKVLEIGTGSGYEAALLALLVQEVHTVEIIPELAERSKILLGSMKLTNVHEHQSDGSLGWPQESPFDVIVVAAAAPDVPPPLLEQLKTPGKLLVPIGKGPRETLTLFEKTKSGVTRTEFGGCAFVPLRGAYGVLD